MRPLFRPPFVFLLGLALSQWPSGELAAQASSTPMARALDRAVIRLHARRDLAGHLGAGFSRDSLDAQAMLGLGRTPDSTVIAWFSGVARFVDGTDSPACHGLMTGEPTGTHIAGIQSTMDSAAVETWVRQWEHAVVASYLAPVPVIDEEEMMMAVLTLIARLPETRASMNRKPGSKPSKPLTPADECSLMRHFLAEALEMEEPTRMTLLRGLAMTMNEKGESTLNIKQ
jgi:hypothetical protein